MATEVSVRKSSALVSLVGFWGYCVCVCGLGFPDQKQGPGISGMLVLVLRGEGRVSSQGVGECIHHDSGACHRSSRRRCLHMAAAAEQAERGRDWAARWPCLPQLPGQWKPWGSRSSLGGAPRER